jgi:predicted kinase
MQRVERCQAQIWEVARRIAERGLPCVLDVGLGQALSRARLAELARDAGLSVQLHFVDAPTEERWRRVETRNVEKGDTYQLEFDVTREMFDFVESIWEPPTDAEMTACDGIRVSTIQNTEASK